ncbi:MAG: hypothetical protein H8E98_00415, partial [Bacteroidetes bacterium]|nr:hypothetical protein [Bacteroidota bacterium]
PKQIVNQIFSSFNLSSVNEIEKIFEKSVKSVIANEEEWKMKNLTSIQYSSTFKTSFTKDQQNFVEKSLYLNVYKKLKENGS